MNKVPMTKVYENPAALLGAEGTELGATDWITVSQEQVDKFADATLDHQWIHCDVERAQAGPFGAPIAHGYLTMSLASYFLAQLVRVDGISMGINYGAEKVRFPSPVPVGSRLRGRGEILDVKEVPGGVQATTRVTIEREGGEKPAAIVETVSRYLA
jgi:acyl dehydratase